MSVGSSEYFKNTTDGEIDCFQQPAHLLELATFWIDLLYRKSSYLIYMGSKHLLLLVEQLKLSEHQFKQLPLSDKLFQLHLHDCVKLTFANREI